MTFSTKFENYFHVFRDIIRAMHSSTSVKEVLEEVVAKSTEVLSAKGALLRILNKDSNRFEVRAVYGMGERYLHKGPVTTEKLLPDPRELHKVIFITDVWNATRVEYPQQAWDEGIRMMLDVPLAIEDKLIGLIRIYLEKPLGFLDDDVQAFFKGTPLWNFFTHVGTVKQDTGQGVVYLMGNPGRHATQ